MIFNFFEIFEILEIFDILEILFSKTNDKDGNVYIIIYFCHFKENLSLRNERNFNSNKVSSKVKSKH